MLRSRGCNFASWACFFRRRSRARARSGRRGQADMTAVTVTAILHRDDGLFAVAWPPRSWWGPSVSGEKRFPAVNACGTAAPEIPPAAYKSEGRGERRFFTLALRHFNPLCFSSSLCSRHRAASPLELFPFFLSSILAFLVLLSWRCLRPSRSLTRTPGSGRR
jgi:hypothetical protein